MVNRKGQSVSEFTVVMLVLAICGVMLNYVINGSYNVQENTTKAVSND